ncbi:isocitrate/isopropylmalate family dehydrogenase [Acetanaerobacterium elongatum]|uniref:3-isopropylmalate dehydrogenase n=1 Tax=Acetanaerobacterium elongatum TaxID=258515 RepID=A0A1G9V1H8_9FIRM|nr:isocitrate/isopropylmalate family dehydrogenase [Acetanaerobacterium elongatum]SDM65846.1 3-isopropylmalate dehydrogenase [Acetanaerobacterium elongatum]
MSKLSVVVLPGDGVGPEVCAQAVRVLQEVCRIEGVELELAFEEIGYTAYLKEGTPFSSRAAQRCRAANAVLLGPVGDKRSRELPPHLRPEAGVLSLRAKLGLYSNLRPIRLPVLPEGEKTELLLVRELSGGIFYGERGYTKAEEADAAYDTEIYTAGEVERVAKHAFELAQKRRKLVTSVDMAHVLESSRLWRATVTKVAEAFPEVTLDHLTVEEAAGQLVQNPARFDVLLTANLFGSILGAEAGALAGADEVLACASLGYSKLGVYEPVMPTKEELAGKNTVSPLSAILAAGMIFRYSFEMPQAAMLIEQAVIDYTGRLKAAQAKGELLPASGTAETGELILKRIRERLTLL